MARNATYLSLLAGVPLGARYPTRKRPPARGGAAAPRPQEVQGTLGARRATPLGAADAAALFDSSDDEPLVPPPHRRPIYEDD